MASPTHRTVSLSALNSIPFDSRTVFYDEPPHLVKGSDWHDAYIGIIGTVLSQLRSGQREITVPGYPVAYVSENLRSDPLFEIASYWEGAIYYLCKVLGFETALKGLLSLEGMPYRDLNSKHRMFYVIWNSHQQLPLLKAFLISTLQDHKESAWEVKASHKCWKAEELLDWLASYKRQNPSEIFPYPNPLYCGTNGLHLGLIEGGILV